MMWVELEDHYTQLELESQYSSSNSTRKLVSFKKPILELKVELVSSSKQAFKAQACFKLKPVANLHSIWKEIS